MEQGLTTKVWQLHGALAFGGITKGLLILKEGKISFTTSEAEEFNVPISEMKEVKWPFYQFGMSFTAVVNGKKYSFSFIEPENANSATTSFDKFFDLIKALGSMSTGKEASKKWKAILGK